MKSTIDRYILGEYLRIFVYALLFLSLLVVLVRLLDKDIKKFDDDIASLTAIKIILFQTPRRIMEIVPVAGFLATFISLGRMVQDNQLMAMKSAGLSIHRIVFPILVATLLICFTFAIFYNAVASPAFHRANQLKVDQNKLYERNILFKSSENRFVFIRRIDLETNKIDRITIYKFGTDRILSEEIFAKFATWNDDRSVLELEDGFIRKFDGKFEILFNKFASMAISEMENPRRFMSGGKDLRAMTIGELREQIRYKKMIGQATRREEVKLHHKMAYPFATFVVVLIGTPLAIRFGKTGFFTGLVIAFVLNFIYWGVSFATLEGLGESGKLNPIIACWGANFAYGIVGSILLWKAPT